MQNGIHRVHRLRASVLGGLLAVGSAASAQVTAPIPVREVEVRVDSGVVANREPGAEIASLIYSTQISVSDSPWLRLKFDQIVLSGDPEAGSGSFIQITSVEDGGVQRMDARHLEDWNYSTAVFNGDTVIVELFAYPETGENLLSVNTVWAGEPSGPYQPRTICGPTDDRILSADPRQGRLFPNGCTAWLIDRGACANRFLTAGHCISAGATGRMVHFNIPLSTSGGTSVAPAPQDQFPIISASIQSTAGGAIGSDGAQFFTGVNSNTNLQARVYMGGAAYTLAATAPTAAGPVIRITGYGTVETPVSQTWGQVQKTNTGSYAGLQGTILTYAVDTSGGNSGSPVVSEANGLAIGIHTHAGCDVSGGANRGTAVQFTTLSQYLTAPRGPCAAMPFSTPGVEWSLRSVTGPESRRYHAMAYDSARRMIVLFGGSGSTGNPQYLGDTWEWNGVAWTQRVVSGPSARWGHAMAYDVTRRVTVLFGGANIAGVSGETWEWNGTAWTQRAVSGPSARSRHAMAYDAARRVTILFGGSTAAGDSNETWEWNATAWTRRVVAAPTGRSLHGMSFDPIRGVTVLFGGQTGPSSPDGQTWEWNGAAWASRAVVGPSARYGHSMAYDTSRGRTVLFGGNVGGDVSSGETWEWSGAAWSLRTRNGPSPRWTHAMAYHAASAVTLLLGGFSDRFDSDTWGLGFAPNCPADFNQDGGVDGQDVEAFFTAWVTGVAVGDVNLDGGVNGQDVEYFLVRWQQGGC